MNVINVQQTFLHNEIWEPLYQHAVTAEDFEVQLFQSAPVRRLKHIHHYGAASLFCPIVHSRYDHTIGVWSLIKRFFSDNRELRAAAILHDIGHLPFSHSFEKSLGLDHHIYTEELVKSAEIRTILHKSGLSPKRIVELLNEGSPLSSKTDYLGADHLDSFLRDTYLAGKYTIHPSEIVNNIRFNGNFIETDAATGMHLIDAVVQDHQIFLDPHFLAMDAILARVVMLYCQEIGILPDSVHSIVDYELLSLLEACPAEEVQRLLYVILYEPHRITFCQETAVDSLQVEVRKVYKKQPLVNGSPFTNISEIAAQKLNQLDSLCRSFYVTID